MLSTEGVEFRQDDFTLSADFTIAESGITGVIGPSGSGKSTLLALIAGFERPDAGQILWNGRDLTGLSPAERPVSIAFQEHNLFPHLTVLQNVALGLRTSLKLREAERHQVHEALRKVGLAGLDARHPGELSGGQRSRVALARVLVMDRPILLLDEPFAALGPALRAEMGRLVDKLARETGKTVLMVTHAPDEARAIADQLIFVDGGKVSPPDATEKMFADPPAALRAYLGT